MPSITSPVSFCYDYYFLGGYNVLKAFGYFSRYYSGLPSHNMIRFSVNIRKIDTWDAAQGDTFKVQFDSLPEQTGWTSFSGTSQIQRCGINFADSPLIAVVIELPYTPSDITVTITSYLNSNSNDESLGFRDVTMTFYTLAVPPTDQTFCGITSFPLNDRWCSCSATNYYMAPAKSGSCYPCDPTCATCSSATQYNCLTCYPGWYKSGSQCFRCDSSCKTCSGSGQYQCLSCPVEKYLTVLGNCVDDCPLPLINNASNFTEYCYSPCGPSNYLYPDMSCQSTCTIPFMVPQTVDNYFLLCLYPCQGHEFLFYNGSCGTSCPSPLTKSTNFGKLFCNYACTSTQTLFWDGSCSTSSCSSPVISYTEGTATWVRKFCGYPCNTTEYLYWNSSCLTVCPLNTPPKRDGLFCSF